MALGKALHSLLARWAAFARFVDDDWIYLTNNAAEYALRDIAIGRQFWLFPRSERAGDRAATIYTPIMTAKLNAVNPLASLSAALKRCADHLANRIDGMLPWNWRETRAEAA